jgi:predicted small secreted protein
VRVLVVIVLFGSLTACGTVSGVMTGAGKDLQKAGEWLDKKTQDL